VSQDTSNVQGGFWDSVGSTFLDVARARLIDTETNNDTRNTQDRADVARGRADEKLAENTSVLSRQVAGVPMWGWGAGLVGVALLFTLLRK
jgi:hypothetical protein